MVRMTTIADGQCHRVTGDAVAVGITARSGIYQAVCRRRVRPTAMICADGPSCQWCELAMRARRILLNGVRESSVRRRRHRRPGWLYGILAPRRRASATMKRDRSSINQ